MTHKDNLNLKGVIRHYLVTEDKPIGEDTFEFRKRMEVEGKIVGSEVYPIEAPNLVTTVGKYYVADRVIGTATVYQADTNSGLMGWGVDNTAAAASDTTLGDEVWRDLYTSSTRSNAVISWAGFMPKTGSGTNADGDLVPNGSSLTEVSMFVKGKNTGGSLQTPTFTKDTGAMINHAIYGSISKTSTLALVTEIDWTIS